MIFLTQSKSAFLVRTEGEIQIGCCVYFFLNVPELKFMIATTKRTRAKIALTKVQKISVDLRSFWGTGTCSGSVMILLNMLTTK